MQAQGTQVTISRLQRSVADSLATVRYGFKEEYLEPRTGYSLDLALPSSRVAVEVDGPSHFLLPDGRGVRKPNGPTLLKRRLLAAAGWRVISVPFYEWDGLNTADERQAYLERAVGPPCAAAPQASPGGCTSLPSCSSPGPAARSLAADKGRTTKLTAAAAPAAAPAPRKRVGIARSRPVPLQWS
mmetsp:Transcript_46900/g.150909  ORF Transcript_46900/g.150909 Transcript_46900/m.150909 type:complete len:185 (+) Transcript_46900:237-791(+)